jgi:hypothetical protein
MENAQTQYNAGKRYGDAVLTLGAKYYDRRYQDYYTVTGIEPIEYGDDCKVTMQYERRGLQTESANFILYHIEAKQHQPAIF